MPSITRSSGTLPPAILASVGVAMLDSVQHIHERYSELLYALEWAFTIVFTIEYVLRLYCAGHTMRYARSFFGIVDLVAILPTYFSSLLPGAMALTTVRMLRMLRIFRVLKLANYLTTLRKETMWMTRAAGVPHPSMVKLDQFEILDDKLSSESARAHFGYAEDWGLPAEDDLVSLGVRRR